MTKRKNMTAAQRQVKCEKDIEQLQMATRISQMLLQQIGNSSSQMGKDVSELANRQRDVQYRLLALQELSGVDSDALQSRAQELQVKDFEEASDKEDLEKGYTETDVVAEDSVVLITSEVDDGDGILRSKLTVSDLAFPQFKDDLMGKKVGDVIDADINGTTHHVTLLGIRKKPAEVAEDGTVTLDGSSDDVQAPTEGQDDGQAQANG